MPPEIVFFGDPRKPPPVEAARDVVRYVLQHCHSVMTMCTEMLIETCFEASCEEERRDSGGGVWMAE